MRELTLCVHHDGSAYWAEAPEYPGLFASGATIDELMEAVAEAWVLYNHEQPVTAASKPRPAVTTRSMNVLVPA